MILDWSARFSFSFSTCRRKRQVSKTIEDPSYHQGKKKPRIRTRHYKLMMKVNRVGRARLRDIFERRLEETARRSRLTCRKQLARSSTIDRNNCGKKSHMRASGIGRMGGICTNPRNNFRHLGIREQRRPDQHRNILHLQCLPPASIRRCICQRSPMPRFNPPLAVVYPVLLSSSPDALLMPNAFQGSFPCRL